MLHTYTCAAAALGHTDLSDYVVFAALCGLFTSVMLVCATCSAMAGGGCGEGCSVFVLINWLRWVAMATALAVLAVGYSAFFTSLNALQHICIKSLYMLAHAQGNRKNSCYWYIVVM